MRCIKKNPVSKRTSRLPLVSGLVLALLAACGSEPFMDDEGDVASKQSALTCSGPDCEGLDPWLTGCDRDGETLVKVPHSDGGEVELRWSKTCNTKWARVTRRNSYYTGAFVQFPGIEVTGTFDDQVSTLMWSNQTWAPKVRLSACAIITSCRGFCTRIDNWACTPFAAEP